ncbi:MAG: phasin family protein [Pseudomonadota bacterium]
MSKKQKAVAPAGGDMARKIWLAGIGAYGRAFSEAQESLAKVSGETTKLFEDLVERGEEIEDTVETHGRKLASKVKAPSFSMEDRIKQMRDRLQRVETGDDARLDAIEARLGAIEDKLDRLLATAPTKKVVKRATTKRSAKKKSSAS